MTGPSALDSFSQNYRHGDWNRLKDVRPLSLSASRTSAIQQVNGVLQESYSKNCLINVNEFYGVVVDIYDRTVPTAEKRSSQRNLAGTADALVKDCAPYRVYKVYIPELYCQPAPKYLGDPVLASYPEIHDSDNLMHLPAIGSIVRVKYDNFEDLYGGIIVSIDGAIAGDVIPTLRSTLNTAFSNGTPQLVQGSPDASTGEWTSALPNYGFAHWVHPVDPDKFRISSPQARRVHPTTGEMQNHSGIDLAGPHGSPIFAVTHGKVTYRREQISAVSGWNIEIYHGTWIDPATEIEHGIYSRYLHLRNKGSTDHSTDQQATAGTITAMSDYTTSLGQRVQKGTVIGYVGSTGRSTGPHLHYELILSSLRGEQGTSIFGSQKTYVSGLFDQPSDTTAETTSATA